MVEWKGVAEVVVVWKTHFVELEVGGRWERTYCDGVGGQGG